jgi:hypothetical protein
MKMLLSIGLAAHAVIGNFCMMPMAFAQDMEMPHEEHMEMDMTPMDMTSMLPMSPVHCEHCAKMQQSSDSYHPQQQSGCAGHCFSQGHSTTTSTVSFNAPNIVVAASMPITIALAPQITSVVAPPATAPPLSIHIDTIVLRL